MRLATQQPIGCAAAVALGIGIVSPVGGERSAPTDLAGIGVQLTAGSDPLDVLQTASDNFSTISGRFWTPFFPSLQQEIVDRLGLIGDGLAHPENIGVNFSKFLDLVNTATAAHFETFIPDFDGAPADTGGLYGSIDPAHAAYLAGATLPTPEAGFNPLDETFLLNFLTSPSAGIIWGNVGTALSPFVQYGADVAGIVDDLSNADVTAALRGLVEMPVNIAGAFLNGYGSIALADLGLPGIPLSVLNPEVTGEITSVNLGGSLSPGGSIFQAFGLDGGGDGSVDGTAVGTLGSLVEIQEAIAVALGWDPSTYTYPMEALFDSF